MSDKNKYDAFEKIIQNKLNESSLEYGKSWDDIANELDAKQNTKSNTFKYLLGLLIIVILGAIFTLYNNNPSLETGDSAKKEKKLY